MPIVMLLLVGLFSWANGAQAEEFYLSPYVGGTEANPYHPMQLVQA